MIKAKPPANETQRLASIKQMQILLTPAEESFDRVTRTVKRHFDVPVVFISVVADDYKWFKSKIGIDDEKGPRDLSVCGHIVEFGEIIALEDLTKDERFFDNDLLCSAMNIRFYMGRPLRNAEGFVVGTLCVIAHEPRPISPEMLQSIDDFGYWVEAIFANRGLSVAVDGLLLELDEIRRESMMDNMLAVWNRSAIEEILKREAAQALRLESELSILMLDVDYFKKVNDFYGHHAGDQCLVNITSSLRNQLRSYDSIGRYGGEEFMVILPDTNQRDAYALAERLRKSVEKAETRVEGETIKNTISIGIATVNYKAQEHDINQVAIAADKALLLAKRSGRNQVHFSVLN